MKTCYCFFFIFLLLPLTWLGCHVSCTEGIQSTVQWMGFILLRQSPSQLQEINNLLILRLQSAWSVSHTLTCMALPLMSSNSSRHQNQPFYCTPVSSDAPPLKHPLSDPLETPLVSSILQTEVYSVHQHLSSSESWAGLTQLPIRWCLGVARWKDCRSKSQDHESANC